MNVVNMVLRLAQHNIHVERLIHKWTEYSLFYRALLQKRPILLRMTYIHMNIVLRQGYECACQWRVNLVSLRMCVSIVNESRHTYEWLRTTHVNESWHTYERVIHEWVMAHVRICDSWMSHNTHTNVPFHTCQWGISRVRILCCTTAFLYIYTREIFVCACVCVCVCVCACEGMHIILTGTRGCLRERIHTVLYRRLFWLISRLFWLIIWLFWLVSVTRAESHTVALRDGILGGRYK